MKRRRFIAWTVSLVMCSATLTGCDDLLRFWHLSGTVEIDVLKNDGRKPEDHPRIVSVNPPTYGSAEITAQNTIRYTLSDPNSVAVDEFKYTATDDTGKTTSSTVRAVGVTQFRWHGCNFSPYIDGQDPRWGGTVTPEQLRDRLKIAASYCDWVRFYGLAADLKAGPEIARQYGLKTACGAWIGPSDSANQQELTRLVEVAPKCDLLVVGNEALLRNDVTPATLVGYMNQIRSAVPNKPITTAEVDRALLANPSVIQASDVVSANIHPWWQQFSVDGAVSKLYFDWQGLVAASGGKEVIISETGWRSFGGQLGRAVASEPNLLKLHRNLAAFQNATGIKIFIFSVFDEPWKSGDDGWGWRYSSTVEKPGIHNLFVNGPAWNNDNWSRDNLVCGTGTPEITLSYIPPICDVSDSDCIVNKWIEGQVHHLVPQDHYVVVYIKVGTTWWLKPYADDRRVIWIAGSGTFNTLVATGGMDYAASDYAVFALPNTVDPMGLPVNVHNSSFPPASITSGARASIIVNAATSSTPNVLCGPVP